MAAITVFTSATLLHLGLSWSPSFWYDEAATLRLARLQWPEFLEFIEGRDAVHALYAAFMHFWILVLGESELSARLPSILAAGSATAGVFVLAQKMSGTRRGGIVAALVFALLPRTFIQSIEARSYMISTALLVGAALLAIYGKTSRRTIAWAGYVATATLAIWCFAYAILVLPALVLLGDDSNRSTRSRLIRVALTGFLPGALSIPLALMMFRQQGQIAWLGGQAVNLYTILIEPFFHWGIWLALGFPAAVIASAVRGLLPPVKLQLPFWLWMLLPGAVLLAATALHHPLFAPRYLTVSTPALALICGLMMSRWSGKSLTATIIIWVISSTPLWVGSRLPEAKPGGINYREVAESIRKDSQPGDGFILGNSGAGALRPRNALAAYPASFTQLKDVSRMLPYSNTGTFWDETYIPSSASLRACRRIWVAKLVGDASFNRELRDAGFSSAKTTTVSGITIVEWDRSD